MAAQAMESGAGSAGGVPSRTPRPRVETTQSQPPKVQVGREKAVDMGPSLIPLIFGAVLLALWLLAPGDKRDQVRRRMSRDRDFYLSLALVPVGLVIIAYVLSPWIWPERLAWVSLPVIVGVALRWLLGADVPEVAEGIELPEELRTKLADPHTKRK